MRRRYNGSTLSHTRKTNARSGSMHVQRHAARQTIRRGYPVHKRLCLHPLAVFIFLCTGVFMTGWTYRALADTVISATIQAPPLHDPAVITSPETDDTITTAPTVVTGTCPSQSYVKLYVNGTFKGVDWCAPNNTFSIVTILFNGKNILDAQAYNTTDAPGPDSAPLTVNYLPPVPPSGGGGDGDTTPETPSSNQSVGNTDDKPSSAVVGATEEAATPLLLSSDFEFYTFKESQKFDWTMSVEGGRPPYNVYINWGDGETSKLYFPEDPTFVIHHVYKTSGHYPVVVRSVDSTGSNKIVQLLALITNKAGEAPFLGSLHGGNGSKTPSTSSSHPKEEGGVFGHTERHVAWLMVAWPSYIIVALMTLSFWLGERREVDVITQHPRAKHRKRLQTKHA